MAKEEKTLSAEDLKRIQKEYDIFEFKTVHDTFGVSNEEAFKAGAEYEHNYQREQQEELRKDVQRYHQTLIARYYNGSPETKPILNTIIDEIDKMLIKWNSPKEV